MTAIVVISVLVGVIVYSNYVEIDQIAAQLPETRNHILGEIDSLLQEANMHVDVLNDEGILRLSDGVVNFESGEIEPINRHKMNVGKLAHVLAQVIPFYISSLHQTSTFQSSEDHNTGRFYCSRTSDYTCKETHNSVWLVGTILIEGHTDTALVPVDKYRFKDNLELSSMRAAEVYRMITDCEPAIGTMKNLSYRIEP